MNYGYLICTQKNNRYRPSSDRHQPANVRHPDPADQQAFHSLYSLASGKEILSHTSTFKQLYGQTSGWKTQTAGGYVCVQDLSTGLWNIYEENGSTVATEQAGLEKASWKFLSYNASKRVSYFLVMEEGIKLPIIKPITVK
ncbi:hypothetical protein [Paenibacillus zanthoxyli]|uniref:hypothetical protein n=1 Tax=Paenibacillus zanthoxyli TaxID=369399 RepID=UPI00046F461E|nr:hypothetical protein [Paenibacillus zanthoxyli]